MAGPQWRAGYRYDWLDHGMVSNGIVDSGVGPRRRIYRFS